MTVIVITGPTASGKSSLALELAAEMDIEIVSADSAQVYRGMDIGTAKPDAATLALVPHHLIDVREPCEPYSAADFRDDAVQCVRDIESRGKTAVVCGGTMLYLKALKEGISELPEADVATRQQLLSEAEQHGWGRLHKELQQVDAKSAERIKPSDTQRLQRALEVYRLTGQPLSELHAQQGTPCPFPLKEIAIVPPDRALLHETIAARFHDMLEAGFVEEVTSLFDNPSNHATLPAMKAVGYRQMWSMLEGKVDYEEAVELSIVATRQLAKRQYTWLRGWQDLNVLDAADLAEALKIIRSDTILA